MYKLLYLKDKMYQNVVWRTLPAKGRESAPYEHYLLLKAYKKEPKPAMYFSRLTVVTV
jgi:hypothetical protein